MNFNKNKTESKTENPPHTSCYGVRHFHMLCLMHVYYLNVFCLSFVSKTKALYDSLSYVQLKRRQGISVNVFGALLNFLQSVPNLLHERQSVVACCHISQSLKEISQSLLIGTVLLFFIHSPEGLQNSKLFFICLFVAGVSLLSQHNNVRERSFERFSQVIVLSFEQVNTSWVFWYLAQPVLVFWSAFRLCSAVIVVQHPRPNDGLYFLLLALNVAYQLYSQIQHCSRLRQFAGV